MIETTTVRNLRRGDVLAGSGFIVVVTPWAGVRCPKGHVFIEGNYPGGEIKRYEWNARTRVSVLGV